MISDLYRENSCIDTSSTALDNVEFVSQQLKCLHHKYAKSLNISDSELDDIVNGKKIVLGVRYPKHRLTIKSIGTYFCMLSLLTLLIICIAIPGFSDTVRETLLLKKDTSISTNVKLVAYDKYNDSIDKSVLPEFMIEGFKCIKHAKLSDVDVTYALYTDQNGDTIEFFHYPDGAQASYDNEFSDYHTLTTNRGVVHVGHTEEETTVLYFIQDEAYVQLDFSFWVEDGVLRQIAESVHLIK